MSELWRRTVGNLAAMIRSGEVSSREVLYEAVQVV